MPVKITFWGVRGSIPCCSAEHTLYGGNTSCVEVNLDGDIIIFDAGSGIRALGVNLAQRKINNMTLLISHTHWDHICGFPFFYPAFQETSNLNIYAARLPNGQTAEEIFDMLMSAPFFPLPMHMIPSVLHFHNFKISESFKLFDNRVEVLTHPLVHPNGATGYRLNYQGKSISYISDYEHCSPEGINELVDFVKDSDLMIFDAMYTPEEYEFFKGWGHSTWFEASKLTQAANVKQTALFHHAPIHTDQMMYQLEQNAQKENPRLFAAKENMSFILGNNSIHIKNPGASNI